MAVREIIKKGDTLLTKKAHDVTRFDQKLHNLIEDMRETLRASAGVGLAAPQIGILRRFAVIETPEGEWFELINPEIVASDGTIEDVEGCLSVPHTYGIVSRPETVTVRAQDRFGKVFEQKAEGYTARIFCHEIDHLNGILFTQKVIRYIDPDQEKG